MSSNTAWEGLDGAIMGAENSAVKGLERVRRAGRAGAVGAARDVRCAECAECAENGGLGGFRGCGYFQAKVCSRPAIRMSKRPGSTTGLFSALMNDKSSLVNSKM